MRDLSTTYMGLKLKNPIIIGSGPLTASLDNLKRCEDSGAGAVVLKSIFEEQIARDSEKLVEDNEEYLTHSDAAAFVRGHSTEQAIDAYLTLLQDAKKALSIPVIASLNCKSGEGWTEYAKRFVASGADALEINHYVVAADGQVSGEKVEKEFLILVKNARKTVKSPLAVKMGTFYSSLSNMMHQFSDIGVDGVVLFNRFFQNDIDIEKETLSQGAVLSSPSDYLVSLRWTALMSAELDMDICASGGIWNGETVIKQLLAGAKACSICSAAMKKGFPVVNEMLSVLDGWMEKKGYASVDAFRGKLAQEHMKDPELWERSQYMKALQVKGV